MPAPHPLSLRPTYALPALRTYFAHISLPPSHQTPILHNIPSLSSTTSSTWGTSSSALQTLGTLQKYQQAAIPFSNLYLHYSQYYTGTPLDSEAVWRYLIRGTAMVGGSAGFARSFTNSKNEQEEVMNARAGMGEVMTERERKWEGRTASGGRGGTCTLNNGFFGTVMRSLGMRVLCTGARVSMGYGGDERMEGRFAGWNHMINLAGVEGRWWLVDVGFGGDGPTAPLELVDGAEMPWGNTSSLVRVIHTSIPEVTDPSSKVWVLQHKSSSADAWKDTYCFTTTEFLPQDIKVMNFSTAGDVRGSFFNHMVICQKTVLDGEDIVGTLSLAGGKLKRSVSKEGGWESEVLAECKSEVERWEALEEWFGIVLGEGERRGIRGLVTELKGQAGD